MCGRYYVDDDTAREIQKFVQNAEEKIKTGDVLPSQAAAVLEYQNGERKLTKMRWGIPRVHGTGLLINARAESILERPVFRENIRSRRCIIPAGGFYEWNRNKEKFQFEINGRSIMYLAGCFDAQRQFVILTVEANESVLPVHDRMPLILGDSEARVWMEDGEAVVRLLNTPPPLLARQTDYEQIRLPF